MEVYFLHGQSVSHKSTDEAKHAAAAAAAETYTRKKEEEGRGRERTSQGVLRGTTLQADELALDGEGGRCKASSPLPLALLPLHSKALQASLKTPFLMNLVTAVIVEGAIQQGKQDREATARYKKYEFLKMLPHLKTLFKQIDINGNGRITRNEVQVAPEHIKRELADYFQSDGSLLELFDLLDVDESGELDAGEFCDGLAKLVHSASPVELMRVLKQLKILRKGQNELLQLLGSVDSSLLHHASAADYNGSCSDSRRVAIAESFST